MNYKNEADFYIQKMLDFYEIQTLAELAIQIGISQPSISGWKSKNYVNAIKNRCKELSIFDKIFDEEPDPNMFKINNQKNDFRHSFNRGVSQNFGSSPILNLTKDHEFEDFDQDIVGLFKTVYKKFEEKNNLKVLFDILSELKWK